MASILDTIAVLPLAVSNCQRKKGLEIKSTSLQIDNLMITLGRIVSQMLLLVFGLLVTNVVSSSASNGTERHSVSVAKRERESNITLSWLNPRTMQIIWPDQVTDFIHLQSSKNLDGKNVYVSLDPTKHDIQYTWISEW